MVKLEMHYINTGKFPLSVMGKISFDTVPLSTMVTKSDLAFWGTTQINIPPNSAGDTGVLFQRALAGTKTFALTTHQHQLGTEMLVWYGEGANDRTRRRSRTVRAGPTRPSSSSRSLWISRRTAATP